MARATHDVTPVRDAAALLTALRRERVGGTFWAAQPALPAGRDLLLCPADRGQLDAMLTSLSAAERSRALALAPAGLALPADLPRITGPCDPWWLAEHAARCLCDTNNELALVMALMGRPVQVSGTGPFAAAAQGPDAALQLALGGLDCTNPFDGQPWPLVEAIAQLGEWRRLIDSNRSVAAVFGIAGWKRVTADAMLWPGSGPVPYCRTLPRRLGAGSRVGVWKSRTAPAVLQAIESNGCTVGEIEDGFIRSVGLGANCVPPLSLIFDFSGVYFDPNGPSDLEAILENYHISDEIRGRAAALRQQLVKAAISKYARGGTAIIRPEGSRRRVLVTGQVEDDRSVLSGGAGATNLGLLARARALEPDAWIIYKPHPDVEAGHRKGHVPESEARRFADEVQHDAPIIPLIDSADALHVITSLAGFEALLRGKHVTTHGVPFYAGWGLTQDLAQIPPRRTRSRSLDELVAATLLLYPRYFDPVTRLPCPAEVVVQQMAADRARISSPLIVLREWQGRFQLAWRKLTGGV